MKHIISFFSIFYKIYYFLFFVISLAVLFPFFYYLLSNPKRFPKAFRLMQFYGKSIVFCTGVKLKVEGLENIPKQGSYIICPNHSSFLDIFCIYSIFPNYFVFTGKKEIEKWPLFHIFYTTGMNILVDRHSKTGAIAALKRMNQELRNGRPIVIFPEGTISKNAPKLAPFKSGAFALAIQNKVSILPVTFVNNWKLLQRSGIWSGSAHPGISQIVIHPPVSCTEYSKEDSLQLQEKIEEIISKPLFGKQIS